MFTLQDIADGLDWVDIATLMPEQSGLSSVLSSFVKRNKTSLIRAGLVAGSAAAFLIPVVGPVTGPLATAAAAALNPKGSAPSQAQQPGQFVIPGLFSSARARQAAAAGTPPAPTTGLNRAAFALAAVGAIVMLKR